jgi:hypothetical protein
MRAIAATVLLSKTVTKNKSQSIFDCARGPSTEAVLASRRLGRRHTEKRRAAAVRPGPDLQMSFLEFDANPSP